MGQQPCQQAEDPVLVQSTLTSEYYSLPTSLFSDGPLSFAGSGEVI